MKYCICILSLFIIINAGFAYAERVLLKNGQKYEGYILEENEEIIRIQTKYGIAVLNKDQVVSIVDDDALPSKKKMYRYDPYVMGLDKTIDLYKYKSDSEYDDIGSANNNVESSMDSKDSIIGNKDVSGSDIAHYKNQVIYLNQQIKIYKEEINNFETEIAELKEKFKKKEKDFNKKIETLEEEKEKKEKILSTTKFPELKPIEGEQEVEINMEYLKSVKFIVSETIDGFFVGAQYKLYSEFISVKPNFDVFFFNANGLNIGKDTVEYKYNRLERGQQELIEKGIPMTIPGSPPLYYYIKLKK